MFIMLRQISIIGIDFITLDIHISLPLYNASS